MMLNSDPPRRAIQMIAQRKLSQKDCEAAAEAKRAQPVSLLRPNPGGAERERDCDQEEQDVTGPCNARRRRWP
jgi:hypothetical protein